MSINQSIANKRRWERMSPEEKKKRMSALGRISSSKKTPEQMKKHIRKMVRSRKTNQ